MPVSANLRAAQEVLRLRASATSTRNAASTSKKPMSIRAATTLYKGSSPAAVHRLIRKIESDDIPAQPGRPYALTDDEDKALVAFVVRIQSTSFLATKAEIEDAANLFRKCRDPDTASISKI